MCPATDHPRLQELTIRRQHVELAHPGGYEFVNRESCPEMVEKDGSGLLPGTTNRLAKMPEDMSCPPSVAAIRIAP
jgi:hypothetical protein